MAGTTAKLLALCKQFEAAGIGYDQSQRDSWHDAKYTKIIKNKEADCSSATLGLVKMAGYPIDLSGQHNTSNAAQLLKAAGWKIVSYTGKSQCKAGRVFITPGHHMNIATSTTQMYNVGIDERGKASGGKAGDQTGKESRYEGFFNYPWRYVAIPPDEGKAAAKPKPSASRPAAKKPTTMKAPKFPLDKGQVFGPANGGDDCISGKVAREDYTLTQIHGWIKQWQQRMKDRGWGEMKVTGVYDATTAKIVGQFEAEKKIPDSKTSKGAWDKLIGPNVWKAAWEEPVT